MRQHDSGKFIIHETDSDHSENDGQNQKNIQEVLEQLEVAQPVFKDGEVLSSQNGDMEVEQLMYNNSFERVKKEESKFYSIKTIKVAWMDNNNSFMHVFIDNTNVKRLSKEKAMNKCLHIMFSSISHEFRTPLNALMNATSILKSQFREIKELFESHQLDQLNNQLKPILKDNIEQ